MYRSTDGSSFTVSIELTDDNGLPLNLQAGWPKVVVMEGKDSIAYSFGTPTAEPGVWQATLTLPDMDLKDAQTFKVRWRLKTTDGEAITQWDTVLVEPKVDIRDGDIVVLSGDTEGSFVLPYSYVPNTGATLQMYTRNNEILTSPLSLDDPRVRISSAAKKSKVVVPIPDVSILPPALFANLMIAKDTVFGKPANYTYQVWVITPQIALAAQKLEEFLNKSRIENVIPELDWTYSDLLGALERGLNMFNLLGNITSFDGTNMQGVLLDAWLLCSSYCAISTQLLAEGSLAFDFSGQGVSLNVDRTPQLDAAIGRLDSQIQSMIMPLKKQLATQGIISGTGSIGSTAMRDPNSIGKTYLTNAVTTRLNGLGLGGLHRRW